MRCIKEISYSKIYDKIVCLAALLEAQHGREHTKSWSMHAFLFLEKWFVYGRCELSGISPTPPRSPNRKESNVWIRDFESANLRNLFLNAFQREYFSLSLAKWTRTYFHIYQFSRLILHFATAKRRQSHQNPLQWSIYRFEMILFSFLETRTTYIWSNDANRQWMADLLTFSQEFLSFHTRYQFTYNQIKTIKSTQKNYN